jgi:hypothetical protein
MRYMFVVPFLVWASVPPLFLAAFVIADRLRLPVPGDILVFCAAGWMAIFGLPLSLVLVVCAAVSAVVIYLWERRQGPAG